MSKGVSSKWLSRLGVSSQAYPSWVPLAFVLILAFLLRCVNLDGSFWDDEIRTYGRVSSGFIHAWTCSDVPLSYFLSFLGRCLGDGEVPMRLPHVLAGVSSVGMGYFMGSRIGGRHAAVIVALLLAVSAYHIQWSQTARYYALLMLVGQVMFWALSRSLSTNLRCYWLLYGISCLLGILTHKTFLLILPWACLGALIWILLTRGIARRKDRVIRIFILGMCTMVALLGSFGVSPALPGLWRQVAVAPQPTEEIDESSLFNLPIMSKSSISEVNESAVQLPHKWPADDAHWYFFRLGSAQYFNQFFDEYFRGFTDGPASLLLFGLFAFFGAVILSRKMPSLAAPVITTLYLLPVPFFFIQVKHHWAAHYFSIVVPLTFLLAGIGIAHVPALCHRTILGKDFFGSGEKLHSGPKTRPGRTPCLIVVITVALIMGTAATRGLTHHYTVQPWRNWKGVAKTISETLQPDDLVVYYSPYEWGHINLYLGLSHYLAKFMPPSRSLSFDIMHCTAKQDVLNLVSEYRNSTVWIVTDGRENLFPDPIELGSGTDFRLSMNVLGEPTINLSTLPGFEDRALGKERPGVEFVGPEEAFAGNRAVKLTNEEPAFSFQEESPPFLEVPVRPTRYPINNSSFEVWNNSTPAHWDVSGGNPDAIAESIAEVRTGRASVMFPNGKGSVRIEQVLESQPVPGMTIMASVWGKAEMPQQLSLSLVFDQGLSQEEIVGHHSGGGSWEKVICRGVVPGDAVQGTVSCIIRNQASVYDAFVDDVKLIAVAPILDLLQTYTLSMRMKHINAKSSLFSVYLAGKELGGGAFRKELLRVPNLSRDWYLLSLPVVPGKDLPAQVEDLSVRFELSSSIRGTLWIDNMQFEAKEHVTPFVDGERLPYPEQLEALEESMP